MHVYQAGLDFVSVWKDLVPVRVYRGLYMRPSPLWHDCSLRITPEPPQGRTPWLEFLVIFDFLHHDRSVCVCGGGGGGGGREILYINRIKNAKEKLVKCATEVACLSFFVQSCTGRARCFGLCAPHQCSADKVVHKIGRFQKFNPARKIEFKFA